MRLASKPQRKRLSTSKTGTAVTLPTASPDREQGFRWPSQSLLAPPQQLQTARPACQSPGRHDTEDTPRGDGASVVPRRQCLRQRPRQRPRASAQALSDGCRRCRMPLTRRRRAETRPRGRGKKDKALQKHRLPSPPMLDILLSSCENPHVPKAPSGKSIDNSASPVS